MRLRFGQPSFVVLVMFAVIAGIIFYFWDNPPPAIMQSTTQEATHNTTTDTLAQVASPMPTATAFGNLDSFVSRDIALPTVVPSPTPAVEVTQTGFRQEIPSGTRIFIPRAGIEAPIIQAYLDGTSWDVSQLGRNVGHLEGTGWLGEPGANVVLSGHVEMSDGRGGIFSNLDKLEIGNVITLTSQGRAYTYIVSEISLTSPTDIEPVLPKGDDRLTLITCNDYDFFSNSYRERRIVIAMLLDTNG